MSSARLLIGIGSPHSDDRVGWEIARRVDQRLKGAFPVRCARAPAELLDWLDRIDTLEICDALVGPAAAGSVFCWQWPAPEIARAPFRGTHDLSLPAVLTLAEKLGRLPALVRIWGVTVQPPGALDSLSPAVAAALPAVVDRICGVLVHA